MRRIIVIGTSGSGKTTLARAIAARLGLPHGEQDAWNHEANWQEAPLERFRARVDAFTRQAGWVMDGNYGKARDLGWPRADTLVWLDLPAQTVFWRLLRRTLRRVLTREELWNGNRETLRGQFSKDSIIPWFFRTHWRRRRETPELIAQYPQLTVVRLRSAREARAWLSRLPASAPTGAGRPAGPERPS